MLLLGLLLPLPLLPQLVAHATLMGLTGGPYCASQVRGSGRQLGCDGQPVWWRVWWIGGKHGPPYSCV